MFMLQIIIIALPLTVHSHPPHSKQSDPPLLDLFQLNTSGTPIHLCTQHTQHTFSSKAIALKYKYGQAMAFQ